MSSKALH